MEIKREEFKMTANMSIEDAVTHCIREKQFYEIVHNNGLYDETKVSINLSLGDGLGWYRMKLGKTLKRSVYREIAKNLELDPESIEDILIVLDTNVIMENLDEIIKIFKHDAIIASCDYDTSTALMIAQINQKAKVVDMIKYDDEALRHEYINEITASVIRDLDSIINIHETVISTDNIIKIIQTLESAFKN